MIHHYQEELQQSLEKTAEFFGLTKAGIYVQFVVMLGTLSFLKFGESTNLFIIPALESYPWIHTLAFVFGIAAKFFTTCVGAIATMKFITGVWTNIKNKFKKKEDETKIS